MLVKICSLGLVLILAVSCGGSGGVPSPEITPPEAKTEAVEIGAGKACAVKFNKSDKPIDIATKANQMRIECKLTEKEVVAQAKKL